MAFFFEMIYSGILCFVKALKKIENIVFFFFFFGEKREIEDIFLIQELIVVIQERSN